MKRTAYAGGATAAAQALAGMPRTLEVSYALSALPPRLRDGARSTVGRDHPRDGRVGRL
jgi:hypothetical protein